MFFAMFISGRIKMINMLLWKFRERGMHMLDCIHRCHNDALLPAKQFGLWGRMLPKGVCGCLGG